MKKLLLLVFALITMLGACEYPPDYLAYASASRALMELSPGYRSIFISGEELDALLGFWPLKDYPFEEQGELLSADLSLLDSGAYYYMVELQSDKDIEVLKVEYGPCFKGGWEKSPNEWSAFSTREDGQEYCIYCLLTPNKKGTGVCFSFDFYDVPVKEVSDFLEARWPKIRGVPDLGKPSGMDYSYSVSSETIMVNYSWDVGAKKAAEVFEELCDTLSGYQHFFCDEDMISFTADDMIVIISCDEYIGISVIISTDDYNEKLHKAN